MTASSLIKWLEQGVRLHEAGRLTEADRLYRKVLKIDARNPDALNLQGLIASQTGRHAEAIALYDRAIAAYPEFAGAYYNKGSALSAMGRDAEAVQAYAQAIHFQPAHADARLNAGGALHKLGRTDEAIAAFRAMTQLFPGDWRGSYNLGSCLSASYDTAPEEMRPVIADEAAAALTRALALNPGNTDVGLALARAQAQREDYAAAAEALRRALETASACPPKTRAEVLSTLGEYLRKQRLYTEAIENHRRALSLCPDNHLIQFNLAAALYDAGRRDEAERLYKLAIATKPAFVNAYVNLGNIYRDKNEHEKAISILEKALTFGPTFEAYTNIGATLSDLGWMSTSLMIHDKAASLGPANATTRYNRALTLLGLGRFDLGWPEHEARFDVGYVETIRRAEPQWRGEDLSGKTVLVWTEQGIGDQILHASMIPDLIARAGHVLIECVARLAPIFARSFPSATVIGRTSRTASPADTHNYDFQIAAGSLGQYLRRDRESFPGRVSYLHADTTKVQGFRRKYLDLARGRRIVGLAWRSLNPRVGGDKSAGLADLAPALQTSDTLFVNLQYGDCAADLIEARSRFGATIFEDPDVEQLKDMDSFFAQVAALDLVVTTSNSTVHVAGSQGVPTHLLLPHGKGVVWYWFQHRADSPWYPSVKIFRARTATSDHPWAIEPAQRIAAELSSRPTPVLREIL